MQTTGGHRSLLNGKIERPHQTITKMFNSAIADCGHNKNKWCFACETTCEVYNSIYHTDVHEQPAYLWCNHRNRIHDFRVWGCEVYVTNHYRTKSSDRTTRGYFMGYTPTRYILRWWNTHTNKITLDTGAKFNDINFNKPKGDIAPG